jgi:hypothetical protein
VVAAGAAVAEPLAVRRPPVVVQRPAVRRPAVVVRRRRLAAQGLAVVPLAEAAHPGDAAAGAAAGH